ncbi:NAD(P)-dependent oxidoreductase [Vagococcus lutrae]|uniref:NAD(P)-dependent oxidoreductase n=1 Tax=Vagococcus lutrae TaxID=81947 RepID=UPI001FCFAE1A|nr:NAD(P)-dependent oxidoreductase [Vagococcus lutrae]
MTKRYKILIADYPDSMMPSHDYEQEILVKGLKNCEIQIHEYSDKHLAAFYEAIVDADALLTGFIPMNEEALNHAPQLKIISMNATGYDNVDLEEANQRQIGVCPVGEYCSEDVAEFTIATMAMLVKNLKTHTYNVEQDYIWEYASAGENPRIEEMTLGIVGFGKIGKQVGKRAKALGMRVIAHDPFINDEIFSQQGVKQVSKEELVMTSDVICNHMNLNETNYDYFDYSLFAHAKKNPYFINMGRGASVVEEDLVKALDEKLLKGAAVDVLSDETPDLKHHPLVGRSNVIVTPHAAFYTTTSVAKLQRVSCENIVHFLSGEYDKVNKLVNKQIFD